MSRRTINLTEQLYGYVLSIGGREPQVLRQLREETAKLPSANMQIAPDQGQFMAMLVKLTGATRVLEVGTYTGYSALAMALAMPDQGYILCCDISREWTSVAQRYWRQAGVDHKMALQLRPAIQTLDATLAAEGEGCFDFAFIDADKESYELYYERCLRLVRPGGLIAVDNVLWNGAVIDPGADDADTRAIREFNVRRRDDQRVDISLVPIGDGVTLLRKR